MMTPAALLFDMDGTIAETEELHRCCFNRAFAAFHLPWHWDEPTYHRLLDVPGGRERIAAYATRTGTADYVALTDNPALDALHRWKTTDMAALLASGDSGLVARPGVARLCREALSAGVALALVTTSQRPVAEQVLRQTLGEELAAGFRVVICGSDVRVKKPDPESYLLALQRLGVDAGQAVAVEDSAVGLHSARSAGLRCVITESLYTREQDFSGAALAVSDLGEPDRWPVPVRPVRGGAPVAPVTVASLGRLLQAVPA
ncbi:HAD-IA family hydrolase [Novispirillum itersonii]|uniref:HAD superfamily hydrolase (TIGR01509 family) n=1 Tax=Novispirillum itersonii TaxID=189 RepID=A0A7W9ZF12_NOVIT|nr:HAD-IA family hydrolase [Novispirillum itersonii]MBB6209908.1 HAD superfamily hydrolase (TIGR01509 family) [Novispirillum itersonii]